MLRTDLAAVSRQGDVCSQKVFVFLEELCQVWAADFLLTLQQELHSSALFDSVAFHSVVNVIDH